MNVQKLLVLVASCVLSITATAQSNLSNLPSTPQTIRIGYLSDFSGPGASLGIQSQRGALLAEREFRSQGQDVKVIFEDTQTDSKQAVNAARKLLEIDNVDVIISDLTPPSMAVSPLVLAAGRLHLYQAPIVSLLKSNPSAFMNFLDYRTGCRQVAESWKARGVKQIANLKINMEFGELCREGSAEVFPQQIVIDYNSKDDLRAIVAKLKSQNIQAVMQTGYEGDYINFFKRSADISYSAITGMPEALVTQQVLKQSQVPEGSTTFGFGDVSPEFVSKLKEAKLYESEINLPSAAIAHHLVQLAVHALQKCAHRDLTCQTASVAQAGPNTTLGFAGFSDGRTAKYDWKLRRWSKGQLVAD